MAAAALAAVLSAAPALASRPGAAVAPERVYVAARAAALSGDHGRSAELLALLVDSHEAGPEIVRKAVSEAVSAGDMPLALRLIGKLPRTDLPLDARLLLAADEVRKDRPQRAVALLSASAQEGADLAFLTPFVSAWMAAERGDARTALAAMARVEPGAILGSARDEHMALLLLKLRRPAEAEPFAQRAVASAGGREQRLRLAFADGFIAAGDHARATAIAADLGISAAAARQRLAAGRPSGLAIDSLEAAFSELLLRLAIDLNQLNNRGLPIGLAQVANHVAPENVPAKLLLAVFLDSRDRVGDALAVLGSIDSRSALASQALDLRVRALSDADRIAEALQVAQGAAARPERGPNDLARLGDVLSTMNRHGEAAAAYGQARALAAGLKPDERWPLLVLQASALEEANRWPEARNLLNEALAIAPDQPVVLNFLGYTKLERGEDLDVAEAMIRKASQLAPEDASITDSLGWALYKRGRLGEAIELLQRAARGDPAQAEIQEHLGDALYRAGRKFEARFAWQAALTTAEDDVAERIRDKIDAGLSQETAAP